MGQICIIYIVILINISRWLNGSGIFKTDFKNIVHFKLDASHSTVLTIIV